MLSLTVCLAVPSSGQGLGLVAQQTQSSPVPIQVVDPLGRTTPRGTIAAFAKATHRDDFVSAVRYMQLTPKQKPNAERLAQQLKELMDRYFSQPLATISDAPSGAIDDGLPLDRDRVGPLMMRNGNADIILVRVNDPEVGKIWLISSETLAEVPALYEAIEKSWIERVMPAPLLEHNLFGVSLALWFGWLASILVPLLFFWLLTLGLSVLKRIANGPDWGRVIKAWHDRLRWPLILLMTLIFHIIAIGYLGFSLTFRIVYRHVASVLLVIVAAWLLLRVSALGFDRVRGMMRRRRETSTESLILLGERLFKVLIVVAAILSILTVAGVDTKTALAGLGIGGVAVALGAQKTVENLLGGIFLLSDKALAVGDLCAISNRQGWIEDITLRSVRLRTLEQTLLSIPAGVLSQANIENFATRSKILAQTILQLRYGTSVEQVRIILSGISKVLGEDPKVEAETARIRLVNFGVRAIELELYAYILTSDFTEFLTLRENLLLQIASVVESAGSGFAQPTEFIYVTPQKGMNGKASEALRDEPQLVPPKLGVEGKAVDERAS